jgi:caa(3)-type oxidase subunit IV
MSNETEKDDEVAEAEKPEAEDEPKAAAKDEPKAAAKDEPKAAAEDEPKAAAEPEADDEPEAKKPADDDEPAPKAAAKESSPGKKKKKKKAARAVSAPPVEAAEKKPAHAAKAPAPHAHAPGHHAPNRKEYLKIFALLFVLTVLEVGVAYLYHYIGKLALVTALIGLALTKAGAVALYFMHLKHETKWMRWTVALPMLFPALYAFILITEGAYRAIWGGS